MTKAGLRLEGTRMVIRNEAQSADLLVSEQQVCRPPRVSKRPVAAYPRSLSTIEEVQSRDA